MADSKEKLFSDFPAVSTEQWMEKITADLKGADFEKKLVWRTNEGFKVKPFYRQEDLEGLKTTEGLPGEFPYVRGTKKNDNTWFVRQEIKVECPKEANAKALDKCVFTFKKKEGMDMEELILDLIDYNVEDEFDEDEEEGTITIYGDPKSYAAIQKHLEECGFEEVGGDFTYIPNDLKDVTPEQRETLDKMVERLEEFDDVQTVYTNMKPASEEEE